MNRLVLLLLLFAVPAWATFPTLESTTASNESSTTTTHTISYPATVNSGDLLLVFFSCYLGNCNASTPTGYEDIQSPTNYAVGNIIGEYAIFGRDADGTEGGDTFDITGGNAQRSATHVLRITGWGGDSTVANDVECANDESIALDDPDPPNVTASWGSDDNLFIEGAATADDDESVTSASTGYSSLLSTVAGGGNQSAAISTAIKTAASASDNPDSMTLTGTEIWMAATCVVQPSAAAADRGAERRRHD